MIGAIQGVKKAGDKTAHQSRAVVGGGGIRSHQAGQENEHGERLVEKARFRPGVLRWAAYFPHGAASF